ncbi:CMGC/MAPK/P38 protein kinase [Blastomyces dermatitidis ER-3]|uniref:CMGC/MAPK/P38 protein kinase, variant 1 n=5 Tax=Blastomyces TaxID=229219 RepID=A0A179UFK1_BLAGS|nr:CMGC/MAPK/P38 protein kinase, variant 1 [Blastomyces gilchristii SLH14081]XP_045279440.1 CMGC/MAPK/P38 protein kinase [Blastomyces dermatitidis ER-3]EGE85085.1 CMGC/MAPK/P38 protein kinase [Blastomyces dermatitidis ATCC 18188]OAS99712.1 CMGC/MAPK/P38 protein kinase [Blastomyces dermatitidis ER-3]OAT06754.1 CMGC/MAPK/P38 protein kinase, variant 1 [Blastomyces gilchristii SLH14081]
MVQFTHVNVFGTCFEVTTRYHHLLPLKIEASSLRCSAIDELICSQVTVKKITKPFRNSELSQKAYLELKLLKHLKHENIAALRDVFMSPEDNIYLITEHQDASLEQLILSQPLGETHYTKVFLYQILRGLKYIHSANVVHCNLKPSNILIGHNCDLRITDFDHARIQGTKVTEPFSEIQCFRTPELLLGECTYEFAIDMWSVGYIFARMINRELFSLEDWKVNSLHAIGYPPRSMMSGIDDANISENLEPLLNTRCKPLRCYINTTDLEAMGLAEHLLAFDPKARYQANQALLHKYVSFYHDPDDEPVSEQRWSVSDTDYVNLPVDTWKTLILSEILDHHNKQLSSEVSSKYVMVEMK